MKERARMTRAYEKLAGVQTFHEGELVFVLRRWGDMSAQNSPRLCCLKSLRRGSISADRQKRRETHASNKWKISEERNIMSNGRILEKKRKIGGKKGVRRRVLSVTWAFVLFV